ncbi:MAG: AAA family ATPase, partial [Chloroflexi bacterium]|nr:AAA family ATPase [Chloroflexota bacterium]
MTSIDSTALPLSHAQNLTPSPSSDLRLRRLELRGFKTFATPTLFEFVHPITAVVGPNGSGKSNLADAVRWALGEQSMRSLRGRKSEDVIFAGSAARAPVGLAEVTLTLDNSEGWIDLPHTEIAVGRRIYRSGESEYLVNRQVVRLREVADLLLRANVGQNDYTVIGQGLADEVLSLRPEERRGLFEEAADVKRHQLKLHQTQTHLASTEGNLLRIADLLSEIKPRLATLERQAKRAETLERLQMELHELSLAWFRDRWLVATERLETAESQLAAVAERVERDRAELESVGVRRVELRERRSTLVETLAVQRRVEAERREVAERLRRELAVAEERARSLLATATSARADLDTLAIRQAAAVGVPAGHERTLAELSARRRELEGTIAAAEAELREDHQRRATERQRWTELEADLHRLSEALTVRRRELAVLAERTRSVAARHRAAGDELDRAESAGAAAATQVVDVDRRLTERRAELAGIVTAGRGHLERTETAGREVSDLEAQLTGVRAERERLHARLEALARWHHELGGYHAGVRAVLRARALGNPTPNAPLRGIVGSVADLIRAPHEVERAVEVALGARWQDVVVERWTDAEAAIAFLKRTNAGRATFLPLDTLRVIDDGRRTGDGRQRTEESRWTTDDRQPPSAASGPPSDGVHGLAADLVSVDPEHEARYPELRKVVRHLLGRTLVVTDLAVARRVLAGLGGGWQIVTIDGEIVRSSGTVTGGAAAAGSDVLGRQRELRELPQAVGDLEEREQLLATRLTTAKRERDQSQAAAAAAARQERDCAASERALVADLRIAQAERDRLLADTTRRRAELERLAGELATLEAQVQDREAAATAAAAAYEDARTAAADLRPARTAAARQAGERQSAHAGLALGGGAGGA